MVFYSIKSNEKVFHLPHCKVARRICKAYKRSFADPETARIAGYRMCSCCSPVGMRLRREQAAVSRFRRKNNMSCHLEDGQLHIITPKSEWRIIVSGKTNKLFLYHKNTYEKYEQIPSIVPGFHSQAIRSTTIVGYLDYIVRHDEFRSQQKKKAKKKANSIRNLQKNKQHYQRNLRKNTQHYQRGTDNRRFNAGQLYSIMDRIYL